ncbi:MAG TPA: hypothetical protein ENH14_00380 [candidate division WOR-3 bacterium]|uniref:Uncharacterized protein n=1 Tax=candidate division WOR-3 bacterium TaxID=2052148 RepID=A0A7V0Q7R1_UNCW3|nr:hypothetical protein [candidate division WOR-3 bacterium]
MGGDKEIQELEIYHPEIYLKANKVIESYNELLEEIVEHAEKEGWTPSYWHTITVAITVDLVRTILDMQADLAQEAEKMWKEILEGEECSNGTIQ